MMKALPGRAITEKTTHKTAPDLNAEQARALLGYRAVESVYVKARQGTKNGGFDAYVYTENEGGSGWSWKKKIGSGFERLAIMFYSSELKEWSQAHPVKEVIEPITYTDKESQEVLALAEELKESTGRVHRGNLYITLIERYGWKKEHTNYAKMKSILDKAGIPAHHNVQVTRNNVKRGGKKKTA